MRGKKKYAKSKRILCRRKKAYSIEDENVSEQIKKEQEIILGYPIYYSNLPKILNDFIIENNAGLYFYNKTKNYTDKLKINKEKCIGCGKCAGLCPMKNISIEEKKAISHESCTMCYRCINNCPVQAITLLGDKVVQQSVIEKYL